MHQPSYILLPVLNGTLYLPELLDSLLDQSDPNWILLVRDDGSEDGSQEMVEQYRRRDERIRVLPPSGHLGAAKGFDLLLRVALDEGAGPFYFCDGDDVWHPEKLSTLGRELDRLEQANGKDVPALVYSELRVIDGQGNLLSKSLLEYAGWHRTDSETAREVLLGGNFVTGCSILLNRAAAELISPIPTEAGLHDGWSALLVAWAGEIHFCAQPLVDYRLHGGNAVGVGRPSRKIQKFLRGLPGSFRIRVTMTENRFRRALAVRNRLQSMSAAPPPNLEFFTDFLGVLALHPIRRIFRFLELSANWHSQLGRMAFLITLPWVDPGILNEQADT